MDIDVKIEKAMDHLGMCGRLLSMSKSDYLDRFPDNKVVFNANVCIGGKKGWIRSSPAQKIWFGDLDVTKDEKVIDDLAHELGEQVYVLREMDARFKNEDAPKLENAVYVTG